MQDKNAEKGAGLWLEDAALDPEKWSTLTLAEHPRPNEKK